MFRKKIFSKYLGVFAKMRKSRILRVKRYVFALNRFSAGRCGHAQEAQLPLGPYNIKQISKTLSKH